MADPTAPRFLRASPVLRSTDYPRRRAYYNERLGFRVIEEDGDSPRFDVLERGRGVIFIEAWVAYLHVDGLGDLHAAYLAAGAAIRRAIEETVYGMREFAIRDTNGYLLPFTGPTE